MFGHFDYYFHMLRKTLLSILLVFSSLLLNLNDAKAIENGNDASGNDFTVFVVTTWNANSIMTCSGALLNDYVVVTAAHCVNDESGLISKQIRIAPPGNSIEYSSDGKIVPKNDWVGADSTQVTTTYQSASTKVADDDLAFLTLTSPLKSNPLVQIASEDEMLKLKSSSAPLKIYGYGYISDAGKAATNPNYMNAQFENIAHPLTNSAYAKSSTSNLCSGDSGGPVVNVTPTQITVIGVATGSVRSNKCSKKQSDGNYYATFTLLNRYANLAFATTSKIASGLNDLSKLRIELVAKQVEIDDANFRIKELEAENEKWSTDNIDLESQIESLKAEIAALKAKLPISITCTKGSLVKKVTAINAKCPAGYKLKS